MENETLVGKLAAASDWLAVPTPWNDGDVAGGGGEDDEVPGGDADQGYGAASGDHNSILQTNSRSRDRMQ